MTVRFHCDYDNFVMTNTNPTGRKPKNIRSRNIKLIIDLYRDHDALSVSEIAGMIKLSRTTVMKINEDLLERDIIEEAGKGDSTEEGGKPPVLFRLNADKSHILTFHIKYDRIEFRLSDLRYNPLVEDREGMNLNDPFPLIAGRMSALLKRNGISGGENILACLIAIHGNVDPESGTCIQSTHFPSWETRTDLKKTVRKALMLDCPILLDNWTRYKAYGESRLGRARGYETAVLIDAGWHGISSGIILEGKVYTGKHFLSGEIGHIRVNRDDSEACACGSRGCLEQQVSLERIRHRIAALAQDYPSSPLASGTPGTADLPEILAAAENNDALARIIVDDVVFWFSLALSQIIMFLDPDIILFDGDYACGNRYFEENLLQSCRSMALPRLSERETAVIFGRENSVPTLKGAAVLAADRFYGYS